MFRACSCCLVVAVLAIAGCQRGEPADPQLTASPSASTRPIALAQSAPTFDASERELMVVVEEFYGALAGALDDPAAVSDDPAVVAAHLQSEVGPTLEPIVALQGAYAALDDARKMALHHEVFRRNPERMRALMVAGAQFADRFRDPARTREFRPILNEVFEPWAEAEAFWVLEGFGPAAVEELEEWTTETEEEERQRKADARKGGSGASPSSAPTPSTEGT